MMIFPRYVGSERWVFVSCHIWLAGEKGRWVSVPFANAFLRLAPDPRIIRAMLKTLT